jgi:hypothetical protein
MEERIYEIEGDEEGFGGMSCVFLDITPKEAKRLYDGLLPFSQSGNWVDALCKRLFPLAAQSELASVEDVSRHEFFALFLSGVGDVF